MRIIDLTHAVTRRMPVFPGDPAVDFRPAMSGGFMVSEITLGTHAGTHIDAPLHAIRNGKAVDEIPLAAFVGRAFVLASESAAIGYEDLQPFKDKVADVSALIIKTGWSAHFYQEDFFTDFPGLEESAVKWFTENGIKLVGLESPSVHPVKHTEIHASLLKNEIIIVESLANTERITQEYCEFYAVPLKLTGLDGSPVRAFVTVDS